MRRLYKDNVIAGTDGAGDGVASLMSDNNGYSLTPVCKPYKRDWAGSIFEKTAKHGPPITDSTEVASTKRIP